MVYRYSSRLCARCGVRISAAAAASVPRHPTVCVSQTPSFRPLATTNTAVVAEAAVAFAAASATADSIGTVTEFEALLMGSAEVQLGLLSVASG